MAEFKDHFSEGSAGYAAHRPSYPPPLVEYLAAAAPATRLALDWSLADLMGYVDTWSASKEAEKALGREPRDRFAHELAQAWGDPRERRAVRWPLSLRVARVHP